jgi:hypothetical protein
MRNETVNRLGYGKVVVWIQSIVDGLFGHAAACEPQSAESREFDTARSARLFAQALHENSNLELDWLWYAANMTRDLERRYCITRALEINPHSSLARSALAKLPSAEPADESIVLPHAKKGF